MGKLRKKQMNDMWDVIASLMPDEIEVYGDNDEAKIVKKDKSINVVYNDENNSFTIDGETLYFKDNVDVIVTMLIPYILQKLDGNKRL